MNNDPTNSFNRTAKVLGKNPLGIITLFLVLVYGLAALLTALSQSLTSTEKLPLIWFLVLFPIIVLGVFVWLVTRHSDKIHPDDFLVPSDFKNDKYFLEFQKQKMRAVASLTTAVGKSGSTTTVSQLEEIVETVETTVRPPSFPQREANGWRTNILWVDDHPDNNIYERRALEAFGLHFTLATSTVAALELLNKNRYAVIISDMGRIEGPKEGYVLLDALREKNDQTIFFIYAGSNLHEHKLKSAAAGAQGSTNDPQELFQMVMNAIIHGL